MSKFQDGFFQDLWCDMVLREADSIYCRFLLEEKKEQAYLAEHEEKKEKTAQKQSEKKSGTRARGSKYKSRYQKQRTRWF